MKAPLAVALLGAAIVLVGCSENGTPTRRSDPDPGVSDSAEPATPKATPRDDDPGLGLPPLRSAAESELTDQGESEFAARCRSCHATPGVSPSGEAPEGAWAAELNGIDPPMLRNLVFRSKFGGRGQYEDLAVATRSMLPPDTADEVVEALVAYQQGLLCGASDFDRDTLDAAAKRGWDLFRGKASCSMCHNGELFSDGAAHIVAAGADASTQRFLTPTLRGVSQTEPYFHDGSAKTLADAVKRMAAGGAPDVEGKDPIFRPVDLSAAEQADIVAFLEALDCRNTSSL